MEVSQRIYHEATVPWRRLLAYVALYLCVISAAIVLKGTVTFSMAIFTVLWILHWLLYGCFVVQMDTQAIEFGFRFTGRERVPLDVIDLAETLSLEGRAPELRSLLRESIPPIIPAGHHLPPYPVLRLRLKHECPTHYRLRRRRLVREFLLLSREPETILSLLSQHGVRVSPVEVAPGR